MTASAEAPVVQVIRRFKEQLLARDAEQMAEMARRWLLVEQALEANIALLADQTAALKADGRIPTQGQLHRMERYQALLAQARREIEGYEGYAERLIRGGQAHLLAQGLLHAQAAIDASHPFSISVDFKRLPVAAVQHMVGLAGDGSPLRDPLAHIWPEAADSMTRALIANTALGKNPRVTAREMAQGLTNGLNRALLIARTEQLRVYREASRMQYQASGVVRGYKRMAAHNARTCPACLALDGRFYRVDEPFADHPVGRCTLVPCVKGVADPTWQSGEAWLRSQPAEVQREVLGPGHYERWNRGDVQFADLVKVTHSDTWGDSIGVKPLRELPKGGEIGRQPTAGQPASGPRAGDENSRDPDTLPAVAKTLSEREAQMRSQATETALIVDRNGRILLEKGDTENRVSFTDAETALFARNVLTHNHPGGTTFSPDDVRTAATYGIAQVRAVGSQYRYVIQPATGASWDAVQWRDVIEPSLERRFTEVKREFWAAIDTGNMTRDEAGRNHWHEVWTRVARDTGLRYRRERW